MLLDPRHTGDIQAGPLVKVELLLRHPEQARVSGDIAYPQPPNSSESSRILVLVDIRNRRRFDPANVNL